NAPTGAATPTSVRTPRRSSSARCWPARLRSRYAATIASAALPQAMPAAARTGMLVVAFARNAPNRIAGQYSGPSRTSAATARPVGGHTGEIEGPIVAWRSPILATRKYAAASASARANHRSPVNAVLREFVMGRGKDLLPREPEQARRARGSGTGPLAGTPPGLRRPDRSADLYGALHCLAASGVE